MHHGQTCEQKAMAAWCPRTKSRSFARLTRLSRTAVKGLCPAAVSLGTVVKQDRFFFRAPASFSCLDAFKFPETDKYKLFVCFCFFGLAGKEVR